MLQVQEYLRSGKLLGRLPDLYGIRLTYHPTLPLVIANYDMVESPKRHPIAMECRSLVLETGTWDVVARGFTRFFNAGECPDLEKKFDWGSFSTESKEDGSLILLYFYAGEWRVNTRGSFADGEIAPGVGKSWREAFLESLLRPDEIHRLKPDFTFVFELCTPHNKVVRSYEKPVSYLLTAFHPHQGTEVSEFALNLAASKIGALRPDSYPLGDLDEVRKFLDCQEPTFEGVVLRDRHGMRLKVKNSRYVALHHLHSNGNIRLAKNLLPLVMRGEHAEVLTYFPELAGDVFKMVATLEGERARLNAIYSVARHLKTQKEFAIFIGKHTKLTAPLFEARKKGVEPDEVWRESEDVILKVLFEK